MRLLVLGGTGFLGSHLVPKLAANGHEVAVLTRSRRKATRLDAEGVRGILGDLLQPESFLSSIEEVDALVLIAMPSFKVGRISRRMADAFRNQATKFVANAMMAAVRWDCPLILTSGASFRTEGDDIADEGRPIERSGLARLGADTDRLVEEAFRSGFPHIVQMLPGQIYGPGGLFRTMYDWTKRGKYRVIGSGDNYIPRVHVEDCASAYVEVLERLPLGERFIIADDGPCTVRDFADYLADCIGVPRPKSLPSLIARLVMGRLLYETITMNGRVTNAKAKRSLGWKPKYPTYREGLPPTVRALEKLS